MLHESAIATRKQPSGIRGKSKILDPVTVKLRAYYLIYAVYHIMYKD